jgi:hypothetical protein
MSRYRIPLGVTLGLLASAAVLALIPGGGSLGSPERRALLSDCDGAIREIVIHYVRDAAEIVGPTYRDFLRQLPADVTVRVVCRTRDDFDDLMSRTAPTKCVLSPVIVDHPITSWSRDRWLALGPAVGRGRNVLLCPRGENGADIWPDRAGDRQIAADLAVALRPNVAVLPSELYFDGGDFAADNETAFVTPAVLLRNVQRTAGTAEELRDRLAAAVGRRVILLDKAPDHHTAMYMMPVGNRTVLVGAPALARRLLGEAHKEHEAAHWFPGGPDFSDATNARFDAVADQCKAAGYRVVRIPVVPGCDGRTFITYVNVIIDQRADRRVVYMPVFGVADALNRAAARTWAELGYEVRTVNCDGCYRYFGALHCLANVLYRG